MPRLTPSDVSLLAALAESGGRSASLGELIERMDWSARAVPSFDELSFGIPRLVAHGLVAVDYEGSGAPRYQATSAGLALSRAARPGSAHAAAPIRKTGGDDEGDRSLGRSPSLSVEDYDRALRQHARSVSALGLPLVLWGRALSLWQRWRRRRARRRSRANRGPKRLDTSARIDG